MTSRILLYESPLWDVFDFSSPPPHLHQSALIGSVERRRLTMRWFANPILTFALLCIVILFKQLQNVIKNREHR
jgi:hypothetical protein